jgi:hypothetical protein
MVEVLARPQRPGRRRVKPMLYLRWVDSTTLFYGERWTDPAELDKYDTETFCETVGFLIRENDHSIYVAGSVAPDEIGSVTQIPKVAVVDRRLLQVTV